MSRPKKILRNILILSVFLFSFTNLFGLYLNPLTAYKYFERDLHYGPSEIVHIEDIHNEKLILGKYDKWFSCNTATRYLFFFWSVGSGSLGNEIDKTKAINYSLGMSNNLYRAYGVINDDSVSRIEITLYNGDIINETEFYDDMFLVTWKEVNPNNYEFELKSIKAYDSKNNIVFENNF